MGVFSELRFRDTGVVVGITIFGLEIYPSLLMSWSLLGPGPSDGAEHDDVCAVSD